MSEPMNKYPHMCRDGHEEIVRVATQDDIVDVVSHGGKVEEATNEEDAE